LITIKHFDWYGFLFDRAGSIKIVNFVQALGRHKMRLNQKFNGGKVLGLALSLACAFSLYTAGSALADSESGGFVMVGGGDSESGGVYGAGGSSESGGVLNSGGESDSGGVRQNGSESESGGVMSNGSESEAGLGHDSSTESGGEVSGYVPNYGLKYYKW
jgi:hypothetical protein